MLAGHIFKANQPNPPFSDTQIPTGGINPQLVGMVGLFTFHGQETAEVYHDILQLAKGGKGADDAVGCGFFRVPQFMATINDCIL